MPKFSKNELEDMYSSGFSMMDVANKYGTSLHKVAYWMKKFGIKSRSRSEATYLKKNGTKDPFTIASIDNIENRELLAIGVGLFLGEGSKKGHGVRFTNAEPGIVKLFLVFLIRICGVRIEKVHAWINISDDKTYPQILEFWSNITGIPIKNFYAPVVRERKTGTYKNKSKYGTITILVDNKKLFEQINFWCSRYLQQLAEVVQW